MKKPILLFIFFLTTLLSFAQEASDNYILGVFPVTTSVSGGEKYVEKLNAILSVAFLEKKRFTIVDRTKLEQITKERNLQKQEEFLDGFVAEQGKSLGAQYLIQGNIDNLSAQSTQIRKSRTVGSYPNQTTQYYYVPGYSVTASVSITIFDVSTGQIKGTKIFNLSGTWETENREEAINASLNKLSPKIEKGARVSKAPLFIWINDMFPVAMKILKVEESDKKGRPKMVLIKGGEDMDLHRGRMGGSILQVYINDKMEIDGKVFDRQLPIGEIMVDENQGEFTICKVKDGADEILKRMNEGKTLLLKMIKW